MGFGQLTGWFIVKINIPIIPCGWHKRDAIKNPLFQ